MRDILICCGFAKTYSNTPSRLRLGQLFPLSASDMKRPRSLRIAERVVGTGGVCVPGDVAVCNCRCTLRKGDLVFESASGTPYFIRVGSREHFAAIEYGLLGMRTGGLRSVTVPPSLGYDERKVYPDLPDNCLLIYDLQLVDLRGKWDPDMEQRLASS